jgi:hypothetical protein
MNESMSPERFTDSEGVGGYTTPISDEGMQHERKLQAASNEKMDRDNLELEEKHKGEKKAENPSDPMSRLEKYF